MRFYFLDESDLIFLTLLCMLFIFFTPYLGLFLLVIFLITLFSLRVRNPLSISSNKDLYSPASGKIVKIEESEKDQQIFIKMKASGDWGVYSPIKTRVMSFGRINKHEAIGFIKKIKLLVRIFLKGDLSLFQSDVIELDFPYQHFKLNFLRTPLNLQFMYLNIDIGDKLMPTSLLGFQLGRGYVVFTFSKDYKLLVNEGDTLVGGRSIIRESIHE